MVTARTVSRVEKLVWILIYGGLFVLILGYATQREAVVTGWVLMVLGGGAAVAGIVLIWVRSRWTDIDKRSI